MGLAFLAVVVTVPVNTETGELLAVVMLTGLESGE